MGYMIRFRDGGDAEDYKRAGRKAKKGLIMVMEGLDSGDKSMIVEGAEKAWDGIKAMCDTQDGIEERYGERRNDSLRDRDGWGLRHDHRGASYLRDGDWNGRDDEWMERRMRDSRGRYM